MKQYYPYLLVTIQMTSLGYLLLSGPLFAREPWGLVVEFGGVLLGLVAIWVMKPVGINITPLVREGGSLVERGPYRIIRHPMYIAQVIAVIPLVIDHFTYWRLAAVLVLFINLLFKLHFEERQLMAHFPAYADYRKRSYRLIPYIY